MFHHHNKVVKLGLHHRKIHLSFIHRSRLNHHYEYQLLSSFLVVVFLAAIENLVQLSIGLGAVQ
jgi:hypothetical protein